MVTVPASGDAPRIAGALGQEAGRRRNRCDPQFLIRFGPNAVTLELNRQLPEIGAAEELYAQALAFAGVPFLPAAS